MTQSERIVGKFGEGNFSKGRDFLVANGDYKATRIRAWQMTGWVPQPEHQVLLDLAVKHSIDLTAYDFIHHLVAPRAA